MVDKVLWVYDNEDESNSNDYISIISCICGCALQHLPQPSSTYFRCVCNICNGDIDGEVYHCEACLFDAHTHCVVIEDQVDVFFISYSSSSCSRLLCRQAQCCMLFLQGINAT